MRNLQSSKDSRWFPSKEQLKDPVKLERSFRQLLSQHYDLQDRFSALHAQVQDQSSKQSSGPPPGSGPTDSMILGLRVAPVDVQTLADGAALKFSKKDGNFKFS
jgi:hypothetical protein